MCPPRSSPPPPPPGPLYNPPLYPASLSSYVSVAQCELEQNAPYRLRACYGLSSATAKLSIDYVRLLSDISVLLPGIVQGWTALHCATAANCIRAIQLLVSAGADVNAQTNPEVR